MNTIINQRLDTVNYYQKDQEHHPLHCLVLTEWLQDITEKNLLGDLLNQQTQTERHDISILRQSLIINRLENTIEIPTTPVQSVSAVTSFTDDDTESTFASTKYFVDTAREPARLFLRDGEAWPTGLRVANGLKIVYVAGYGSNRTDVPEAIRVAILQYIAFNYEHRGDFEGQIKPPTMLQGLLQPYRRLSFTNNPYGSGNGIY